MVFSGMAHPFEKGHPGISPLWANLPKRHCDNCHNWYRPARPLNPPREKYGFCSRECKKQFHRNGCALIQLRKATGKLVKEQFRELDAETMARIAALESEVKAQRKILESMGSGPLIRPDVQCRWCHGRGECFTSEGKHVCQCVEAARKFNSPEFLAGSIPVRRASR